MMLEKLRRVGSTVISDEELYSNQLVLSETIFMKTWLITGVSSGFGAELAKAVIEKGDNVVATFRKGEQAAAFTTQYADAGFGIVLDVTKADQVRAGVQQSIRKFGRIDVLVNNAGYGTIGAIEEFSMEEIRQQMETNFFGAVAMTKEVLPLMRKQGGGNIIQISSQSGFRAAAGFGLYNASKFALEGFSEALAQEVADFGIRIVIVEPGPFRTKFLGSSMKLSSNTIAEYEPTPVGQMRLYMERMNGKQEGDPVKAAAAIVEYVRSNKKNLRLPLGKLSVLGIRTKLADVEKDVAANEAIANSVVFV
jgi:NAD(P)-dependent dehydrogenase (short-subunit alcohol dehydrogenase family)